MTTPIPYIGVLPPDAFTTYETRQVVKATFEYVKRNNNVDPYTDACLKDYFAFNWPYLDPYTWRRTGQPIPAYLGIPQTQWQFKSWGPDRLDPTCAAGRGDDFSLAYDPTNGTVSHGDLCRFGP